MDKNELKTRINDFLVREGYTPEKLEELKISPNELINKIIDTENSDYDEDLGMFENQSSYIAQAAEKFEEENKNISPDESDKKTKEYTNLLKVIQKIYNDEKSVETEALSPYSNEQLKTTDENISSDLLQEYGNNYFEFITYDPSVNNGENGGKITLAGVLKEVPSFSMNAEWEAGPAATISDAVKGWFTDPKMEMFIALGGRDRAWMNLDEGTDRSYKTTSRPSFDLSFKVFSTENIGSQSLTNWKNWIKTLSLFSMPSVDSKISINAMGNNVVNGVSGNYENFKTFANSFTSTFAEGKAKTSAGTEATDDKSIIDSIATNVKNIFNSTVAGADAVINKVTSRDGEGRVTSTSNHNNFYGAKLWYLRILPGIFKNPLIVYISNWSVTYSKEINVNTYEPIWVEFKINCVMDQIASAPVWMKYITGSVNA